MHKICLQLNIILLPKYNFYSDSGLIMQINGKTIVPSEIGLNDFKAENIVDVQMCLTTLDSIKCCQGAISCFKYPEIKSSYGMQYIQSNNQWRHLKCSTIVKDDDRLNK